MSYIATQYEARLAACLLEESVVIVSYVLSKIRAWNLYRETVDELSRLSDRELADIGVSRWQIPYIAKESVFATPDDRQRGNDRRSAPAVTKRPSIGGGQIAFGGASRS